MRTPFGAVTLALAVSTVGFVNCADSEPSSDPPIERDAAPGADANAGDADTPDARRAPCDAGAPTCTSVSLPCSATDFCPVTSTINAQYAVNAVWGSSATDVWVVGSAGTIARWDGASFHLEPPVTPFTLNAIWGSGPQDVWAVSTPDVILRRGASGSWAKTTPTETAADRIQSVLLRAVWGPDDGSTVLVGGNRLSPYTGPEVQIWGSRTTASVEWVALSEIPFFTVHGIWGSSADDVWAVGFVFNAGGMAFHGVRSEDNTQQWTLTDFQSSTILDAVWGSGPNDVWAVGRQGTIRHYAGSGARWDIVASPTDQDLHAVWGSGPDDAWIAGDGGTLLHWDGVKWRRLVASFPIGQNPNLYGLWGRGPNDVWAVGESATILHSSGVRTTAQGDEP